MFEKLKRKIMIKYHMWDMIWMLKAVVFLSERGYKSSQIDNILYEILWVRAYLFVYGGSAAIIYWTFIGRY